MTRLPCGRILEMTARVLLVLVTISLFILGAFAAPTQAVEAGLRAAVVRLEAGVDPTSGGPALVRALAARKRPTPYERELLRRLKVGAVGTGFFVNSDGCLVTNAHVVLSGVRYRKLRLSQTEWDSLRLVLLAYRDLWVTVGEGSEARDYLARPVAISEDLDLAILKVGLPPGEAAGFAFLPMARSSALRVDDQVLSLGFPEYEFRSSRGHILSLIQGKTAHEDMQLVQSTDPETGETITTVSGVSPGPVLRFQHNAPTGHGSSGGPLLNADGQVIGVAYALLSETDPEGNTELRSDLNLGLASDMLMRLLKENRVAFTEVRP